VKDANYIGITVSHLRDKNKKIIIWWLLKDVLDDHQVLPSVLVNGVV
jgi:hypothetical protein